jgi:hypothetical protein
MVGGTPSATTESVGRRRCLMSALERKLGAWQAAEAPAWNVTRGTDGHLVRLTYQPQFAEGLASEQLVWRIERSGATLLGHHVNATLLVTQ